MHYLKSFSRVKSTLVIKIRFNKGNELKLIQVELVSFFIFKNVCNAEVDGWVIYVYNV